MATLPACALTPFHPEKTRASAPATATKETNGFRMGDLLGRGFCAERSRAGKTCASAQLWNTLETPSSCGASAAGSPIPAAHSPGTFAAERLGLTRRRDRRMLKFGIVAVRRVAGSPINRDFEAVVFRPPGQFDSWDGRVRSHKRVATHLTGRGEGTIPIATTPPWGDEALSESIEWRWTP